jgi:amidophosphoribosyltransferase
VIVRVLAVAVGAFLALATVLSAVQTLAVPRPVPVRLTRIVFRAMRGVFQLRVRAARTYERGEHAMASYAPISLLVLVVTWLVLEVAAFTLVFWGLVDRLSPVEAFEASGSSVTTLGFVPVRGAWAQTAAFGEAAIGLLLLALLITYLPTMYSAFQRREALVTRAAMYAGSPPSGPLTLARFNALAGLDALEVQVWTPWTAGFVDLEESHTSIGALAFFRSPVPERSWITATGAVLDAAALRASTLDLPRELSAELCMRAGYLALRRIADFYGIPHDPDPDPGDPISILREEWDDVVRELREAGVPIRTDLDEAWRDFAGWRVNYDTVLLALAGLVAAPYALWSSDRSPTQVFRPPLRRGLGRRHNGGETRASSRGKVGPPWQHGAVPVPPDPAAPLEDDLLVDPEGDSPKEACGVFGIYAPGQPVAHLTYLGLYALQHRGQESAGMAVSDGETIMIDKDMGLVPNVFNDRRLAALPGHLATGHTRYSTTGSSTWRNAQPVYRPVGAAGFALAHNGNLVNTEALADEAGMLPGTVASDSDLVGELLANVMEAGADIEQALVEVLPQLKGAFSFVLMDEQRVIGVRDPNGFRPLCLGKLDTGWVLASETPALDVVGAHMVREVEPGEMVIIDVDGVRSMRPFAADTVDPRLCLFEFVYFARPDSRLYGQSMHMARQRMGELLAEQAPVDADLVMPVPDGGIPGAQGFARASGIPYGDGLVRNRYIGRTFIAPTQELRRNAVRIKLNPLRENVAGNRLVVVEDSIVRGTTLRETLRMLKEAGAAEIHLRIMSPPYRWPCFYGMDTGDRSELLAANMEVEEIREYLGVNSLAYLTIDRLLGATGAHGAGFCTACLTGDYPVPVPVNLRKGVLEKNEMPASDLERLEHEPF